MKVITAVLGILTALLLGGCTSQSHGHPSPPNPDAPKSISPSELAQVSSAAAAAAAPTTTETVTVTVTAKPKTRTIVRTVTPKAGPVTHGTTYKVTSDSGSASSVTYENQGSIEQATGVSLPWSRTVDGCGILCEVNAQNSGSGSITCEIIGADGSLLDKHTSTGAYAVVSCQA